MVEDVKVIYQAIGKAAGLNVLFDPDYTSKRIPIDLTNVTLSDALRIVGTLSGTFYKPVTSNTIFVAQNTRTKRAELDEQAVQTFYLTNASQQNDANEVLTAIRNLLDPSTKIYLVPSQNAIVMRATPDQLLLAQKLLNDLDRARPEVVVDVADPRGQPRQDAQARPHPAAVRSALLLRPPQEPTRPQAAAPAPAPAARRRPLPTSPSTRSPISTPPTSRSASAAPRSTRCSTDADTRILQNPNIRATDGQRATLKIGQRIPYRHRLLQCRSLHRHCQHRRPDPVHLSSMSASTST